MSILSCLHRAQKNKTTSIAILRIGKFILLFCGMLLHASVSSAATGEVIIVGGDESYPPYEFIDKEGKPAGYNVELTLAIAKVMGIQVEIHLGKWNDMRDALLRNDDTKGKIDILEGIVISTERSELYSFSPPHSITHESIFAREGSPSVSDLKELSGKEVIIQRGGFTHERFLKKKQRPKLILVDTHSEALSLLAAGKHDYALVGNLPGLYLSHERNLSNIKPVGKPYPALPYGYAVKRGNENLLALFSEGLAILKKNGKQQEIYDKWLAPLKKADIPWSKIVFTGGLIIGPLILVLGGIIIWNRSLKREVERRTKELRQQQQQLIQIDKMASLGILISGVAHEINNPVGLILYNIPVLSRIYTVAMENLEDQYQENGDFMIGGLQYSMIRKEIPQMFIEMREGAKRIKRIVEDLKDFARVESSDLSAVVNLNEVTQAAIRLVDNSIKKSTSHFKVRYCKETPEFKGNSQRIEQVIVNLVLNACQSLPSQESGIFLKTRVHASTNEVSLEVRDEGCGIPDEHLPHLKDPFFTTKRGHGGTGLGLSISTGIIEEHQGQLNISSVHGKGTTITLALPMLKGECRQ